jgi:hypothetical protein
LWMHSQSGTIVEGVQMTHDTPMLISTNDKILVYFQYEANPA